MSAAPLANSKHEKYCLLIAAGFEPSEAHVRAGYTADTKGGNATKLLSRPEIVERIAWLKGEHVEKREPSADPASLMKHLVELAYNAATPAAVQLRAIEIIAELNEKSELWPGDEDFDMNRLSERQRELCQLYSVRPVQKSPADIIFEKLEAMRSKADSADRGPEELDTQQPAPSRLTFQTVEERTCVSVRTVRHHGQR